jgi:hypothetical protein
MVLRPKRLVLVSLAVLPALLFAAACGGGDDNGGSSDDGTPPAVAETFVAARPTPTGQAATAGPRRGTATPRGDEFEIGPIDVVPAEVPPEAQRAVDAVIAEVLRRLIEVSAEDITVLDVSAQDWSDSCLDVVYANQEEPCLEAITPGYEVVVHFGDTVQTWHTDADGSAVRFAAQQIITSE